MRRRQFTLLVDARPLMRTRSLPIPDRLRAFVLVCLQLALILLIVHRFDIETQKHFFPMLCLAVAGFVVHTWLPGRYRVWFFTGLSLAGLLFVLGWPNGTWVIGIGGGLIALCHLPVPLVFRILLLAAAGVQLAVFRLEYHDKPFWPVLGSMFMFRLMVYVFETRHERRRPPLGHTLAYFFPLPNVSFLFFPILDFKTFRETYQEDVSAETAQAGVGWIVRGLSHLLAYRVIKYYLLPGPQELSDLPHLALFLAANYALYLHVSGCFHIITGIFHLFGFALPRTHHNYFLASSFTDIWRRINIYWKDFMMKVFFFPAFFALRGLGTRAAVAVAALGVFVATWLLHYYQVFWMTGFPPQPGQRPARREPVARGRRPGRLELSTRPEPSQTTLCLSSEDYSTERGRQFPSCRRHVRADQPILGLLEHAGVLQVRDGADRRRPRGAERRRSGASSSSGRRQLRRGGTARAGPADSARFAAVTTFVNCIGVGADRDAGRHRPSGDSPGRRGFRPPGRRRDGRPAARVRDAG
jgi:hypothetical protein